MIYWLKTMSHPDNNIALFNDAAFDIAPCPKSLEDYARRLGIKESLEKSSCWINKVSYLKSSGYIRVDYYKANLFLDVAHVCLPSMRLAGMGHESDWSRQNDLLFAGLLELPR